MPRRVDDAHPAAPQHPLHVVADYVRQFTWRLGRSRGIARRIARRKQLTDFLFQPPQPLESGLNFR